MVVAVVKIGADVVVAAGTTTRRQQQSGSVGSD
jgi:hypothetical protein